MFLLYLLCYLDKSIWFYMLIHFSKKQYPNQMKMIWCLPKQSFVVIGVNGWQWWFSRYVVSDSCYSVDWSLPGSSVHGILQARILEWVVIPFSRGSSWPRDWTCVSYIAGDLLHCRQILYCWATMDNPIFIIKVTNFVWNSDIFITMVSSMKSVYLSQTVIFWLNSKSLYISEQSIHWLYNIRLSTYSFLM